MGTEGSAFLILFRASGVFNLSPPLLSIGNAVRMTVGVLLLTSSGSKEVTGTSPVIFVRDVEHVAGILSLPITHIRVAGGAASLYDTSSRITVVAESLIGCSAYVMPLPPRSPSRVVL